MKIQLFIPCFVDQLYPNTAFNMVKVLRKLGCEVGYNTNQTCCGQPAFNAGFCNESKAVAEKFINDFDTLHEVVTDIRKSIDLKGARIRLLGVTVSNLESESTGMIQLDLFP